MLRMTEPHTAFFVAPRGVGKTHLALDLLGKEYKNYFHLITITCPTLKHNETYRGWKWFGLILMLRWVKAWVKHMFPRKHYFFTLIAEIVVKTKENLGLFCELLNLIDLSPRIHIL